MQLSSKNVLLTGATGGLGRAIALGLAGRGATLILSSRKPEELERLAAELPGGGHRTIVADLAEPGAGRRLAEEAAAGGAVDVLVANAGLPGTGRLQKFTADEIDRVIDVNLGAPIHASHALLPAMLERGSGHFVYVSSLAGKTPSPRSSMYNASKFGLRGFALAFRQDLHGSGVSASLVLPGFIRDAGMFADANIDPPPGMGTSTPQAVADGVVSAIESDRAEVTIAPPQQKVAAMLGHVLPSVAARVQRGKGASIADNLASGQRDKR